jgi:hypothetical protein
MPLFSLINLGLFQAGWFCAAWLKDDSTLWMLGLVLIHVALSPTRKQDLEIALWVVPFGLATELLMVIWGGVSFNSTWFLPPWMMLLWCLLAFSMNHSLGWIAKIATHWQVLLAAIFGPASYLAAAGFHSLELLTPNWISLLALAILWSIQFPVMLRIAAHVRSKRITEQPS